MWRSRGTTREYRRGDERGSLGNTRGTPIGASVVLAAGDPGVQGGRGRHVRYSEDHPARNVRWDPLNLDLLLEKLNSRGKTGTETWIPPRRRNVSANGFRAACRRCSKSCAS